MSGIPSGLDMVAVVMLEGLLGWKVGSQERKSKN